MREKKGVKEGSVFGSHDTLLVSHCAFYTPKEGLSCRYMGTSTSMGLRYTDRPPIRPGPRSVQNMSPLHLSFSG